MKYETIFYYISNMKAADFINWKKLNDESAGDIYFKKIKPLKYTFVLYENNYFLGRAEFHYVEKFSEIVNSGHWLPVYIQGHIDHRKQVTINHAEIEIS